MTTLASFVRGTSISFRLRQVGGTLRNLLNSSRLLQDLVVAGEGLYIGIDPFNKDAAGKPVKMVKSKGVKQRVHPVKVIDGTVWVKDSGSGAEAAPRAAPAADSAPASTTRGSSEEAKFAIASDQYACEGFARAARDGIHSSSKDFR